MEAVNFNNDPNIVELLLKYGAKVNERNSFSGETALYEAISKHFEPTEANKAHVKILLDAGADPNVVDKFTDSSALSNLIINYTGTAIQNEILAMLLAKGANPNIGKASTWEPARQRRSALKYVREVLHNDNLAQLLIQYGAKE